ncbi:MAG: hypothetical protein HY329_25675 [Chloroflexi bacterium]|nr:hypothetical protein [Chloroflexota bacterium]
MRGWVGRYRSAAVVLLVLALASATAGHRVDAFFGEGATTGVSAGPTFVALNQATPVWSRLAATDTAGVPAARFGQAAVWDGQANRLLVFGGCVSGNCAATTNDLWQFSATAGWQLLIADGAAGAPPPRYGHTAAWDADGGRLLVFGGFDDARRNDLWQYTTADGWRQLSPNLAEGSPPSGGFAAWDGSAGRLLLFRAGDVWQYTLDAGWRQVTDEGTRGVAPAVEAAAWDPQARRLFAFGGELHHSTGIDHRNDLWQLSVDRGWQPLTANGAPGSPAPRSYYSATWDATAGRLLLFGGFGGGTLYDDLWQYTTAGGWQLLAAHGAGGAPACRAGAAVAWDSARGRLLVFGGTGYEYRRYGDLWQYGVPVGAVPASNTNVRPALPAGAIFVPTVRNGYTEYCGSWRTDLQVSSLDAAKSSTVRVQLVRADGTVAATGAAVTLAPGRSQSLALAALGAPDDFEGSAIVNADAPISVLATHRADDAGLAASVVGVAATGTQVFVPVAIRGPNALGNSSLVIQNAGSAPTARVELRFFRVNETAPVAMRLLPAPIAPGASATFPLATLSALGEEFHGSAVVESDQPLAVTALHYGNLAALASGGETVGGAKLYAPLVVSNNAGFSSSLYVQNTGRFGTEVKVTLVDAATGRYQPPQWHVVAPGAATVWPAQALVGSDERFVGSAIVEVAPGGQVVGAVNQYYPANHQASSYSLGQGDASALVAPIAQPEVAGWSSGLVVQNAGPTEATVTITLVDGAGNIVDGIPSPTRVIPPGKAETWVSLIPAGVKFSGTVIARGSAGSQLVGVVNQVNLSAGPYDLFTTYELTAP